MPNPEHAIADAIRHVTASVQQALDSGCRSRAIDADDIVEILLAIAERLDPPIPASIGEPLELLSAARALLEAREDQMITSAEWERLQGAVSAATPASPQNRVDFPCPDCGEADADRLVWTEDETVRCTTCGTIYMDH